MKSSCEILNMKSFLYWKLQLVTQGSVARANLTSYSNLRKMLSIEGLNGIRLFWADHNLQYQWHTRVPDSDNFCHQYQVFPERSYEACFLCRTQIWDHVSMKCCPQCRVATKLGLLVLQLTESLKIRGWIECKWQDCRLSANFESKWWDVTETGQSVMQYSSVSWWSPRA